MQFSGSAKFIGIKCNPPKTKGFCQVKFLSFLQPPFSSFQKNWVVNTKKETKHIPEWHTKINVLSFSKAPSLLHRQFGYNTNNSKQNTFNSSMTHKNKFPIISRDPLLQRQFGCHYTNKDNTQFNSIFYLQNTSPSVYHHDT